MVRYRRSGSRADRQHRKFDEAGTRARLWDARLMERAERHRSRIPCVTSRGRARRGDQVHMRVAWRRATTGLAELLASTPARGRMNGGAGSPPSPALRACGAAWAPCPGVHCGIPPVGGHRPGVHISRSIRLGERWPGALRAGHGLSHRLPDTGATSRPARPHATGGHALILGLVGS